MRRSILIVMLDVMVLSVLALTARNRGSGGMTNIPVPLSGMTRVVEEGLRNEAGYREEIARLEAQLKESSEVARQALEQARLSAEAAERERTGSEAVRAELRAAELEAERARSDAALATREMELVNQQAALAKERAKALEMQEAQARERTRELERRELEAKARAKAALEKAQLAERKALEAEQLAADAERTAGAKDESVLALKEEMLKARTAQEAAEKRAKELSSVLASRESELISARSAEAQAKAQAKVAVAERERLAAKSEQVTEELIQTRETVAVIKERTKGTEAKVAQLEEEKQLAEEELSKSVWVKRDEALRRVMLSFTEYNGAHNRSYRTDKSVSMPLVKMDQFVFIPAEFKALGLKKTFFNGISDKVTDVRGVLAPLVSGAPYEPLNAVIVPAAEPQVCLVHSSGKEDGALESITMQGLKELRLRTALLFSPHDVNAYGQVEISPVLGRNYLNVQPLSGKKPKTGDYLLTERGQFIGVMVENDICSVLPNKMSSSPKPVIIPLTYHGQQETYWTDFVKRLNDARLMLENHEKVRVF